VIGGSALWMRSLRRVRGVGGWSSTDHATFTQHDSSCRRERGLAENYFCIVLLDSLIYFLSPIPANTPSKMSSKPNEPIAAAGESGSSTPELDSKASSPSSVARVSAYLDRDIDSKAADWISIYACFLTGFTSAHSFTVRPIYCPLRLRPGQCLI
jgi:hypothetical protein